MKYLFLDTNIYIDMIVSRNSSHSADSYELLKILLDHDQVKILVPAIIETEINRHIASEVKNVGRLVQEARRSIDNVYWINHVEEIRTYNEKIGPLKQTLGNMVDEFGRNEERYKNDATQKITGLMQYRNVIRLEENSDLLLKVQKRKLYKLCPFHIEDKESWADALIIETLINIRDFVDIAAEDELYFITRNHKDFSKGNSQTERTIIHPHIEEQLSQKDLLPIFHYRSLYTKTLLEDFADEVTEANIYQQLMEEAEEERREMIDSARHEWHAMERESVGLSSLSSDDAYIERICESDEVEALVSTIESSISSLDAEIESAIEEYSQFEYDLSTISIENLIESILAYNTQSPFLQIIYKRTFSEEEVRDSVLEFVKDHLFLVEDLNSFLASIKSKDYFEIDELVSFRDLDDNIIRLSVDGQLDPRDDDTDSLWVELYKNEERISYGEIEVYYGFINFDEDGGAADGSDESFTYRLERVIDDMADAVQESAESVVQMKGNLNKLRAVLNM
ncbi:PIN domain-containing protein [Paenibacillus sp. FSL P2-0089]|uniref:PIN domain-containing protein n=1 Tax=Paenibacillus sp. FSL P2-0089 TaxID=2954526 RepID=UPI00315A48F9